MEQVNVHGDTRVLLLRASWSSDTMPMTPKFPAMNFRGKLVRTMFGLPSNELVEKIVDSSVDELGNSPASLRAVAVQF